MDANELRASLLGEVGPAKPVAGGKSDHVKVLEDIKKDIGLLGKYFQQSLSNNAKYVDRIVEAYKASTKKGPAAKETKTTNFDFFGGKINKTLSDVLKLTQKTQRDTASSQVLMRKLVGEATRKTGSGCIHVDVDALPRRLYQSLDAIRYAILGLKMPGGRNKSGAGITKIDATSSGSGGGSGKSGKKGGGDDPGDTKWDKAATKMGYIARMAGTFRDNFKEVDIVGKLFEGVLKDNLDYMVSMRATAFETQGITEDQVEAQKKLMELEDATERTGKRRAEVMKAYQANLRKGYRTMEETKAVTYAALNASTMIGSEAQATSATFHGWNMRLGMTQGQTANIGMGMLGIARNTQVTGDALLEVAKSSEKFLQTLRDTGSLTAETAQNVISMRASAEKYGAGGIVDDLLHASSSMNDFFFNSSQQQQTMVIQFATAAGKADQITSGSLFKSKKNMKEMGLSAEKVMQNMTGMTFKQFENASDLQKQFANSQLKLQMGGNASAYSLKQGGQAMIESSKGYLDHMNDLLEKQGKAANKEDKVAVAKKIQGLEAETGMNYLTKLQDTMRNSSVGFTTAMEEMKKGMGEDERKEFEKDLSDFTKGFGANSEGIMRKTVESIKQAGGKDFGADLKKALDSGDDKKQGEVMDAMTAAMQELGITNKKNLDPMSKMAYEIKKLNAWLGDKLGPAMGWMSGIVTVLTGLGGVFSLVATGLSMVASGLQFMAMAGGGGGGGIGAGVGKVLNGASNLFSKSMNFGVNLLKGNAIRVLGAAGGIMAAGNAMAGAWNASSKGYSTVGGVLTGALTGDLDKGSIWGAMGQGAMTGAAIGSLFPGWGTVIGAGIGAAAGGLTQWAKNSGPDDQKYSSEGYDATKYLAMAKGGKITKDGTINAHKDEIIVPAEAQVGFNSDMASDIGMDTLAFGKKTAKDLARNNAELLNVDKQIRKTLFEDGYKKIGKNQMESARLASNIADLNGNSNSVQVWGGNSFAVGTESVNEDQIAKIHKNEQIIPADVNAELQKSGIGPFQDVVSVKKAALIKSKMAALGGLKRNNPDYTQIPEGGGQKSNNMQIPEAAKKKFQDQLNDAQENVKQIPNTKANIEKIIVENAEEAVKKIQKDTDMPDLSPNKSYADRAASVRRNSKGSVSPDVAALERLEILNKHFHDYAKANNMPDGFVESANKEVRRNFDNWLNDAGNTAARSAAQSATQKAKDEAKKNNTEIDPDLENRFYQRFSQLKDPWILETNPIEFSSDKYTDKKGVVQKYPPSMLMDIRNMKFLDEWNIRQKNPGLYQMYFAHGMNAYNGPMTRDYAAELNERMTDEFEASKEGRSAEVHGPFLKEGANPWVNDPTKELGTSDEDMEKKRSMMAVGRTLQYELQRVGQLATARHNAIKTYLENTKYGWRGKDLGYAKQGWFSNNFYEELNESYETWRSKFYTPLLDYASSGNSAGPLAPIPGVSPDNPLIKYRATHGGQLPVIPWSEEAMNPPYDTIAKEILEDSKGDKLSNVFALNRLWPAFPGGTGETGNMWEHKNLTGGKYDFIKDLSGTVDSFRTFDKEATQKLDNDLSGEFNDLKSLYTPNTQLLRQLDKNNQLIEGRNNILPQVSIPENTPGFLGTAPISKNQFGGNYMTNGPGLFLAGEQGRENVQITPMSRMSGQVEPASLTDVHERMQQRESSVEAGPTLIKSDELTSIEQNTKSQISQLIEMNRQIGELIMAMKYSKPSSASNSATPNYNTKSREIPTATDSALWPFGQHTANAYKQSSYPVG